MAYFADIMKEIDDIKGLYALRGDHPMVDGLIESTAAKIATIVQWDTSNAVAVTKAMLESGLTDKHQKTIEVAIDHRTAAYTSTVTGRYVSHGAPARDQTMRHMYNYLTVRDWEVMTDSRSSGAQREAVITARLMKLGVRRASDEGLIKWAMCIIMEIEFQITNAWPSYLDVYNRVNALKDLLRGAQPYRGEYVDKYPEDPRELPDSVFNEAYAINDPPIQRHMPKYEMMSNHVPLRKSSKLLRPPPGVTSMHPHNMAAWTNALQTMPSVNQLVSCNGVPITIFGGKGSDSNWHDRRSSSSQSDESSSAWQWSGSPWASSAWQSTWKPNAAYALQDQAHAQSAPKTSLLNIAPRPVDEDAAMSPVSEPSQPAETSDPASPLANTSGPLAALDNKHKPSEEIEEIAFQALLRKQAKAKAASSAKKKPAAADAGILKKPAAACAAVGMAKPVIKTAGKKPAGSIPTIVCKKPAGSIPTIAGYKITWNPESDIHRDRKTFISLHFHRARKQIPATWSPEDKKTALQPISQMAGVIWDKSSK